MRSEPAESAEMTNQVLFGEWFEIISEDRGKNFTQIKLGHDNYEGWINSGCIHKMNQAEWESLKKQEFIITHDPFTKLTSTHTGNEMILGAGSIVHLISPGKTEINNDTFILPEITQPQDINPRVSIVRYGLSLLSLPYIWGGRTSFGFDCSGLCQNLFRQVGIEIARDASKQATSGKDINFSGETLPGDLIFFDNEEGNIIHVGMIIDEKRVLHASGKVRIDLFDHLGIFAEDKNRYTHNLRLIKRNID
jgi:hypothetical protein